MSDMKVFKVFHTKAVIIIVEAVLKAMNSWHIKKRKLKLGEKGLTELIPTALPLPTSNSSTKPFNLLPTIIASYSMNARKQFGKIYNWIKGIVFLIYKGWFQKKMMEFSMKLAGWVLDDPVIQLKKYIYGLKTLFLPEMHFKANLFFSIMTPSNPPHHSASRLSGWGIQKGRMGSYKGEKTSWL